MKNYLNQYRRRKLDKHMNKIHKDFKCFYHIFDYSAPSKGEKTYEVKLKSYTNKKQGDDEDFLVGELKIGRVKDEKETCFLMQDVKRYLKNKWYQNDVRLIFKDEE